MRVITGKNVNINSNMILGREYDSLIKYSSKYMNQQYPYDDAVSHYMLTVGTAGQLVLAALALENIDAAKKIRSFLNSLNINDFTGGEKNG